MSLLFHPLKAKFDHLDEKSQDLMKKTIQFFENKGKVKLKEDNRDNVWYADFLQFVKESQAFAILMTPEGYGPQDSRWDSSRIVAFNEILGFYGLAYWYTWQVSMLGLVPIFISENEDAKKKAAKLLQEGHIFAFGLSERDHGADLISSEVLLKKNGDSYTVSGRKYYIGNGNKAGMVSVFAKMADSREYVFVVVDSQHEKYKLIKNVVNSQSYVAEFELQDYPIEEKDILYRGRAAWDASLSTVALCKYNLGWASVGICTHAFYEAIRHAGNRVLFKKHVTDFPHIRVLFVEAYARLVAMRLFADRAKDYMRIASAEDRRYLLFNPMVKMKVTMQGEDVINLMWDAIAARGFEKDMYFEMAATDIRGLPKLEGTAHVNMILVVKFINGMLFNQSDDVKVPAVIDNGQNDTFMLNQGATTKALDKVRFQSYETQLKPYQHLANVALFLEQVSALKEFFANHGPNKDQSKDLDFMLTLGEVFTLVPYAMLICEMATLQADKNKVSDATINQIFEVQVRDLSRHALNLYGKPSTSSEQMAAIMKLIKKPDADRSTFDEVWQDVIAFKEAYEMAK